MLAAGHVDADDGDVGRLPADLDGRGQRHRVAGVGEHDLVGQPGGRSAVGLGLDRHHADRATRRPARRAAASDSEPHLPAPPITATVGARPGRRSLDHAGGQRRGAADVHDRERELAGRSSGSTAAIERPKRIA